MQNLVKGEPKYGLEVGTLKISTLTGFVSDGASAPHKLPYRSGAYERSSCTECAKQQTDPRHSKPLQTFVLNLAGW